MEKLQLYMTMTQSDYREMHVCNADSFVQSYVCDLKECVCQVDYPESEVDIFYMIRYVESGMFVIIFRTIPPVAGNHLASWIYIPYTIQISANEINSAVALVASKVKGSQVSAKDLAEINSFFAREYTSDPFSPYFPANQLSAPVAYRYYGAGPGVSLQDLLGQYRFQVSYLPFAGVLLVDQAITTDIVGTNLTSAPLESMAVLLPPELPAGGDSYTPVIYDQKFDVPFYVPIGVNTDIIWENNTSGHGVKQSVYVAQSRMQAPAMGQQVPRPAAQPSASDNGAAMREASAQHEPFGMDLPQRKKTYHFQIPAKSAKIGTVIEFEITTNSDLEGSPIDGYEATADIQEGAGRSNHLLYKAESFKQKLLNNGLYVFIGFVVGLLVGLLATCDRSGSKTEPAPTGQNPEMATVQVEEVAATETPAASENADKAQADGKSAEAAPQSVVSDYSLEAAIRYLDNNDTWTKEEMEKYPDLQGLYDDMNQIRRQKVVETWGPKLKESRIFANSIVRHSRLSYKKKARHTPHNKPEELQAIKIQSYLNNIDP